MAASIWFPGYTVSTTGKFNSQEFTASAGQVYFTLTDFTYTPGSGMLWVFINGQRQESTEFSETSPTTFTLDEACDGGETVTAAIIGI